MPRAILENNVNAVKDILKVNSANRNLDLSYEFSRAVNQGTAEMVKVFLDDGRYDPGQFYNVALFDAIKREKTEMLKHLLEDKRVDPTVGENAIYYAAQHKRTESVKIFLEDGRVDPSVNYGYSIIFAKWNGDVEMAAALIQDTRMDPSCSTRSWLIDSLYKRDGVYNILGGYIQKLRDKEDIFICNSGIDQLILFFLAGNLINENMVFDNFIDLLNNTLSVQSKI